MTRPKTGSQSAVSIVWFRSDLRLADNPALHAAIGQGGSVLPLFIWAPEEEEPWAPGAASRWWLHNSLEKLAGSFGELGSALVLRRGPSLEQLLELARVCKATSIFWNRTYEPASIARDAEIKRQLREAGLRAESFNASVLNEPWTVLNKSGKPFQVFTAYWRACLERPEPAIPLPAPASLPCLQPAPASLALETLELLPRVDWAAGLRAAWVPGEAGGRQELRQFLANHLDGYEQCRDLPGVSGTSRLSPHLHFGEVSPGQVWHALKEVRADASRAADWHRHQFLTELGWREFGRHLLYHFPHITTRPLREPFERFPWRKSPDLVRAWQQGLTGFPLVDAGMRELWTTGFMHNRVRMVAASFLVKNLMVPWQEGAKWFWDTLVDADLASNTLGWQWVSGCGADAAPFFRIFNPILQGEKFDPTGAYARRWVPELSRLPDRWIYKPHQAPAEVLAQARVRLGLDYPEPVVSLFASRNAALEAYQGIRSQVQ